MTSNRDHISPLTEVLTIFSVVAPLSFATIINISDVRRTGDGIHGGIAPITNSSTTEFVCRPMNQRMNTF